MLIVGWMGGEVDRAKGEVEGTRTRRRRKRRRGMDMIFKMVGIGQAGRR